MLKKPLIFPRIISGYEMIYLWGISLGSPLRYDFSFHPPLVHPATSGLLFSLYFFSPNSRPNRGGSSRPESPPATIRLLEETLPSSLSPPLFSTSSWVFFPITYETDCNIHHSLCWHEGGGLERNERGSKTQGLLLFILSFLSSLLLFLLLH